MAAFVAADARDDDLAAVRLLQAERLLDGDLVERVHLVAHAVGDDAAPVRRRTDLRLGVLDPLHGDEQLEGHGGSLLSDANPRTGTARPRARRRRGAASPRAGRWRRTS